jgi:hypothetical protein
MPPPEIKTRMIDSFPAAQSNVAAKHETVDEHELTAQFVCWPKIDARSRHSYAQGPSRGPSGES